VNKLRKDKDAAKKNFEDLKDYTLVAEVHTALDETRANDAAAILV